MNIDEYRALLPEITAANQPYWDGAEAGELRLQRCLRCGTWRFPESPVCPKCLSQEFSWQATSGKGTLFSWIVMHQNYFSAFSDELPYVVAFVRLNEGPMMMSTVLDPPDDLAIDQPLEVLFERIADRAIPKFRLVK